MDPHDLRRIGAESLRRQDRARREAGERARRAVAAADAAADATDSAAADALDLAIGLDGPAFAASAAHAASRLGRHLAAAAEQFHAMGDALRDIHLAELQHRTAAVSRDYVADLIGSDYAPDDDATYQDTLDVLRRVFPPAPPNGSAPPESNTENGAPRTPARRRTHD